MKKQLITFFACLAFSLAGNAQVNPHAIGLRGGFGNFGSGGEVTYQHGMGSMNRLEVDLGWSGSEGLGYKYSHVGISGIYHWVWNLDGGLNWYLGPGAQLGFYSSKYNSNVDGLTLNVGGQLGIEYDLNMLDVPILLSLDARPMWGFLGGTEGFGYGAAFSARYTF